MTRKLTGIATIILAILAAELLYSWAHAWFHEYYHTSSPYKAVAVSMLVLVAVFYPVIHFLEKYLHKASEKYMQGSKSITKNKLLGLLLGFSAAIFFLFVGFAIVWQHKNPLIDLKLWFNSLF